MALKAMEPCLIITFQETTMAMKMEKEARKRQLPGRLIPLPTEISAGCGLSWKAPRQEREALTDMMKECEITPSGFYELG